jgi:hypothetical protein
MCLIYVGAHFASSLHSVHVLVHFLAFLLQVNVWGTGPCSPAAGGRAMKLTTDFHKMPGLIMSEAIPSLPLMPSGYTDITALLQYPSAAR